LIGAASFSSVAILAFALVALTYAGLALYLIRRGINDRVNLVLMIAVIITALWGMSVVSLALIGHPIAVIAAPLMETLRSMSWIGLLVLLLTRLWRIDDRIRFTFLVSVGLGFLFAAQVAVDIASLIFKAETTIDNPAIATLYILSRLLCAIGGVLLVHNLFVNAAPIERWGLRLLCIALGGLFAYDVNLYALQTLYGAVPQSLVEARGVVTLILLPLFVISAQRNKAWKAELKISRQVVFHTLSLVGIGLYLMAMAFGAYGLRMIGGDWAALLQIVFIFGTIIALVVLAFSGRLRSWFKVKINKHFFAYKYDYREEWLKFITTVSQSTRADLDQRVIEGVCNLVDSPGGALWQLDGQGQFVPTARWNFKSMLQGQESATGALARYLSTQRRIANFDEWRTGTGDYPEMKLPKWIADVPQAWLGVPMIHKDELAGFLILERSRAARPLNWEDYDLLRTVGRQVASYVVENQAQRVLIETREFDAFNRRFAFVMHDIKNLVSQLGLVTRNAEKHADNPEFQRDMMLTLKDSVGKMNDLLARLQQHNTGKADHAPVDIVRMVRQLVANRAAAHQLLTFHVQEAAAIINGDEGRLEQVFIHLVQNAIDACPAAPIDVRIKQESDMVQIEIEDSGSGMSEEFIHTELFKPFRTTKQGGYGLGAYEAREIVRHHGGRLDVISKVGDQTIFKVLLPLATKRSVEDREPHAAI
jgi:putative PEP-CTERM system histidine kinase